jgi:1,4-dihydroxy-2-naphthoate octaprenyltransferase
LLLLGNRLFRRAFHAAIPIGNLATAIIVVNNLRDRKTDVLAQKRTTAVRFGETFARSEYALLVLSSYAFLFVLAKSTYEDAWVLPLLSLPAAMPQLEAVALGGKDGAALNDHVGGTARLQLLFCLLLVLGINLSAE